MQEHEEHEEPGYRDSPITPGREPGTTVEPQPARTPSQAEGDRETVIEDIHAKEEEGKL